MIKGVEQRNARADRKNRKKRCKIEDVRIRLKKKDTDKIQGTDEKIRNKK